MNRYEVRSNLCGGEGQVILEHLLSPEQMDGKCGLYARVTIPAGSSLGYHPHHGESETYFILSGLGEYSEGSALAASGHRVVRPGDVTFTPDGAGHGLKNIGGEPLVFMALIILGE